MAVGVVLKLPDYIVPKTTPAEVDEPAQVPAPVPAPQPVTPVVEPEPEIQEKEEPSTDKEQPAFSLFSGEGNTLVSLGYSYGGDKLEYEDGFYDPAGAGAHLRLGYEQFYQNGGGFRLALGLQYGPAEDDVTLRDTYLQLAYQYRSNPLVYGAGVVFHQGPTIDDDSTTIDFDPANGVVLYLENIGDGDLSGWGLSYTFLDIEEEDTDESFDASRAELYYSWRF